MTLTVLIVLKRLLDGWDRKESTGGPTACWLDDVDDENDDDDDDDDDENLPLSSGNK